MFSRWQERDGGGTEGGEDLLLDQLMMGLQPGPIKQELSRQMRRDKKHDLRRHMRRSARLRTGTEDG